MLNRDYAGQNCSIAGTLELIGERWTLLILRDAFHRVRRFEDFQRRLGIARNVLSNRLQTLVEAGILERRLYQEHPARYEYRLTEKGIDLWPVLVTLSQWGDKYVAENGPPVLIEHKSCGGLVDDHLTCDRCGARLGARDCVPREGPGRAAAA
jgi:DNA-binding HxlR family transcriptional regulator